MGDAFLGTLGEGLEEGAHGLGLFGNQLGAGDDDVAVQLHAVRGIGQDHHVLALDAARLQVQQAGEGVAGHGVQVAAHQHGLAQRRVHGGPLHLAHAVGLRKDGEGAAAGIKDGRTQLLAGQIGGLGDAGFLQRHDRGRRGVVDHHDGHRLDGGVRVVGVEFHQRSQVGKAQVVRARGHALDGAGAAGGLHIHIQTDFLEVALLLRVHEQGGRAFETPVELELQGCGLCVGAGQGRGGQQGGGSGLQELAFAHGSTQSEGGRSTG